MPRSALLGHAGLFQATEFSDIFEKVQQTSPFLENMALEPPNKRNGLIYKVEFLCLIGAYPAHKNVLKSADIPVVLLLLCFFQILGLRYRQRLKLPDFELQQQRAQRTHRKMLAETSAGFPLVLVGANFIGTQYRLSLFFHRKSGQ